MYLPSYAMAERFEEEDLMSEKIDQDHLGCGKRSKQANCQYGQFWQHNDSDPSDTEDF